MKQPKTPDPYKTASAQQAAEVGAAGASSIMNNPNIVNPYGSQTYSIAGWEQVPDARGKMISVPRYTQTQTLSPDQQRLLGLETQSQYNMGQTAVEQSAKMRQHLGTAASTAGLRDWGQTRQDQTPTDRAGVQNAMMALYNRGAAGKNAAEATQMAARGMNAGSSQYGGMAKRQGDEFTDATLKAYLGSGDEARAAQESYNAAGAQQDAQRQSQLQEMLAMRNQPINEISALMSGAQVNVPQFAGYQGQGINPANIGQYINNAYNQQSQQAGAFNQGLFNLAGAGLSAFAPSDRRLKKDIKPIRGDIAGVPLYRFRYRFDPGVVRIGVMADEAILRYPDVVAEIGGYLHVDYDRLRHHERGSNP